MAANDFTLILSESKLCVHCGSRFYRKHYKGKGRESRFGKRRFCSNRCQALANRTGKGNRGAENGMARLSDFQAQQILDRGRNGELPIALAREFQCSERTASKIIHRKAWLHLLPSDELPYLPIGSATYKRLPG